MGRYHVCGIGYPLVEVDELPTRNMRPPVAGDPQSHEIHLSNLDAGTADVDDQGYMPPGPRKTSSSY